MGVDHFSTSNKKVWKNFVTKNRTELEYFFIYLWNKLLIINYSTFSVFSGIIPLASPSRPHTFPVPMWIRYLNVTHRSKKGRCPKAFHRVLESSVSERSYAFEFVLISSQYFFNILERIQMHKNVFKRIQTLRDA